MTCFFFAETFRSFLLGHFGHCNKSVICPTVVLKLTITLFLAYIFKHSDRSGLIFFGHFKDVSIYDRKKAAHDYFNQDRTFYHGDWIKFDFRNTSLSPILDDMIRSSAARNEVRSAWYFSAQLLRFSHKLLTLLSVLTLMVYLPGRSDKTEI